MNPSSTEWHSADLANNFFLNEFGNGTEQQQMDHGLTATIQQQQQQQQQPLPGQQQQQQQPQQQPQQQNPPQIGSWMSAPPKIGTRFSSEALKILRAWFANHEHDPYPTPDDIQRLQAQTGLNQRQVTNWFANARRRSKVYHSRPSSPLLRDGDERLSSPSIGQITPIDTPRRRATPAPFEHMNPLQRWENSPPENEAATAHAISRAMAKLSDPPRGRSNRRREGAGSSAVSASSSVSSRGSGSCSSAYSHNSRNSLGSLERVVKRQGRRKRRGGTVRYEGGIQSTTLIQAQNMYQCTFCTETFKTKYDWQRHEKSLHLSLENWVCSPEGPVAAHPELGTVCVFCGLPNPDLAHLNGHNQSACLERPLPERTFHRKDHLQQHLKLVHHAKFINWPMEQWKVGSKEIKSRCGFCGVQIESWVNRIDHLGDHFKRGFTMADWKGDWGFDADVLNRIDNAMPPYLIHYERNSPLPFAATKGPADTPTSAYELIKLELEYYMHNQISVHGSLPPDCDIQFEGCSVILGAEAISTDPASSAASWLWDIFMSSTEIANKARLRPTKDLAESRISRLKVNGKGNIFQDCELEASLKQFVEVQGFLGHSPLDSELQQEACNILNRVELSSPNISKRFIEFLTRLVWGSTAWLTPLRQRSPKALATLPYEGLSILDSSEGGVPVDLASFVADPPWGSPVLDDLGHDIHLGEHQPVSGTNFTGLQPTQNPNLFENNTNNAPPLPHVPSHLEDPTSPITTAPRPAETLIREHYKIRNTTPFFLNDNNSYRRLKRELSRFVLTTMSAKNPNSHVPTDEELKYQARWILYDDDDPWNQTPVDNAEWLREFKRDVGLTSGSDGVNEGSPPILAENQQPLGG